jgi:SprT-like family
MNNPTISHWGEQRLQSLFERYNRIYWHGRLPHYNVTPAILECLGRCYWRRRIIEIDPKQHKSDRHVRATLLHEMAHAATAGTGHGLEYFAQMERLLRRGAVATIETGDAGGVRILDDIVPSRFPLLRKRVQRLEVRRANKINRLVAEKKLPTETIADDRIINDFANGEIAELPWKHALVVVSDQYGLTDETGRPKNEWARRIVAKAKKV